MKQSVLITTNLLKVGKGELRTASLTADIEIKKQDGVFKVFVEGRYAGLNRISPQESWELAADYTGGVLLEDPSFGKPEKKAKHTKRKLKEK